MANIYIRKDEVYRTRIEDITDKDQFFYPVYEQAKKCLEGMVTSTNRYWNEQGSYYRSMEEESRSSSAYRQSSPRSPHSFSNNINPIRLRGYPNNIIAFNADRGYGKTSAMLSFSTALETMSCLSKSQLKKYCKSPEFWPERLNNLQFFPLEPIDPTALEYSDCIIPVIISRMFTHFTEYARQLRSSVSGLYPHETRSPNYSHQNLREQQQQLLQLFQHCYRLADNHKGKREKLESYDDLQLLADRGDSSNFKAQFAKLVHSYLQFMCMDSTGSTAGNPQNAFLIIQIDDADMNPDHAYDVVEDIRKYCVLPNVVILFATNMEQLEMCVEQHFLKSFDPLLKSTVSGDTGSSHTATQSRRQCHSTAVNYLDKLIPSLHRINLPNINDSLQNYDEHVGLHYLPLHQENPPQEYRIVFAELLKSKCLLDIRFEDDIYHPFLPKHMRELTHFLNRLQDLGAIIRDEEKDSLQNPLRELMKWALNTPDSRDCAENARIWKKNLEAMISYLVNDWSELSLKSWQVDTIREIHRVGSDRKIAVAMESMEQSYFRYKTAQERPFNPADARNWNNLMSRIAYFQNKQDYVFARALELYFEMHKTLLTVCDCIKKREEVTHNG